MKKTMLFLPFLLITSCGPNPDAGKSKGVVDCYTLQVRNGSNIVFSGEYLSSYTFVYEYISEEGKKIYTNFRYQYTNFEDNEYKKYWNNVVIFNDRFSENVIYSYSRYVGILLLEKNYYLNLGDRIIDSENKWSEFKYDLPIIPSYESDYEKGNNKEAFECAKKCFFVDIPDSYRSYNIYLNSCESSLERHVYTMVGVDSVITYKAKWF